MYRPDHRVRRPWFAIAWTFLVLIVAFGFFLQARTIDQLQRDEEAITAYITQVEAKQTKSAEDLCGLLLVIDEGGNRDLIVRTFRRLGYECILP